MRLSCTTNMINNDDPEGPLIESEGLTTRRKNEKTVLTHHTL